MTEILSESYCERCGAKFTFEPAGGGPFSRARIVVRGLRNYVTSDASLDEALAEARRERERQASGAQLQAFHETFHFCFSCRQYVCSDCWNEAAGRCRTCAPLPGVPDPLDLRGGPLAVDAKQAVPLVTGEARNEAPATIEAAAPAAPQAATETAGLPPPEVPRLAAAAASPTLEPAPVEVLPWPSEDRPLGAPTELEAGLDLPVEPVAPTPTSSTRVVDDRAGNAAAVAEAASVAQPLELPSEGDARPLGASERQVPAPDRAPLLAEAAALEPEVAPAPSPVPKPAAAATFLPAPEEAPVPVAEPTVQVATPPEVLASPAVEARPEPVMPSSPPVPNLAPPAPPGSRRPAPWRITAPDEVPNLLTPAPPSREAAPGPRQPAAATSMGWLLRRRESAQSQVSPRIARNVWEESTRDLVARPGTGIQACQSCGLPLSANARFCRRCGARQGG